MSVYPNPSNPFKHSIHSEHSEQFKRVKHFEPLGLSLRLKKLILTRRNARKGKRIETLELLRGLYELNARIIGMDGTLELLRGL